MSPLEKQLQELQNQVSELMVFKRAFENISQLDPQLIRNLSLALSATSSKSATSENVVVNEAGAATYSVLGIPNGFIRIGSVDVPYFT